MGQIVLGVGDLAASKNPDDVIITYGIGSCVAVIIANPQIRVAGMAHIALPSSVLHVRQAYEKPGRFADTGVQELLKQIYALGGRKSGLFIKLAGGSSMLDPNGLFNVGKRNIQAIKKCLWENELRVLAEDTGGTIARTVEVAVDSGEAVVTSAGKTHKVL